MTEKISVITISYNSVKTIEKTMRSVLLQTYRPLEYVLIDGSSTDGTIELIQSYIPKFEDAGIEINYDSEPDKGISDAFNKGIFKATGSIIGIINSDDWLVDGALDLIADAFENSNAGVVCGDCLWIDEKNDLHYIRKSKMKLEKLKYEMVLMHPTCFVKKTVYERYGVFDVNLKYVMDKDLMARFYREGVEFKYIPKVITSMSSGGVSDANARKVFDEGSIVATRNGVPKWKAYLRSKYKGIRLEVVSRVKQNKILWRILGKC
jgi:glycosyltransferase involved in cell wall biosynthesis